MWCGQSHLSVQINLMHNLRASPSSNHLPFQTAASHITEGGSDGAHPLNKPMTLIVRVDGEEESVRQVKVNRLK